MVTRDAVLDGLYDCLTGPDCRAAITQGDAWMDGHPGDDEVRGALEGAVMKADGWDVMSEAERLELQALSDNRKVVD
jgi:hypothetical protein